MRCPGQRRDPERIGRVWIHTLIEQISHHADIPATDSRVQYSHQIPLGQRAFEATRLDPLHDADAGVSPAKDIQALRYFFRLESPCQKQVEQSIVACSQGSHFDVPHAALQHAIIMVRIQLRAIAFGQAERPADPDEMIMHRVALAKMLDGTYWTSLDTAMTGGT